MNNSDIVEEYLEAKRKRAIGLINGTTNLSELNEAKADVARRLAEVEMPSLDLSKRKVESISEPPVFQPTDLPLQVGTYYDGVSVDIPVTGDFVLFKKFFDGRDIAGMSIGSDSIRVKQFAFAGGGVEEAKERVKGTVDTIELILSYLAGKVNAHHTALATGIAEALEDRREALTTKQQKDASADPWG